MTLLQAHRILIASSIVACVIYTSQTGHRLYQT